MLLAKEHLTEKMPLLSGSFSSYHSFVKPLDSSFISRPPASSDFTTKRHHIRPSLTFSMTRRDKTVVFRASRTETNISSPSNTAPLDCREILHWLDVVNVTHLPVAPSSSCYQARHNSSLINSPNRDNYFFTSHQNTDNFRTDNSTKNPSLP